MRLFGKTADSEFKTEELRVRHVVDQSGMVNRVDKAMIMAKTEHLHREFATLYDTFCQNPKELVHPEVGSYDLNHFRELYSRGVPVDYIRRYGELRAEVEGEVYDFKCRCTGTTDESLRKLRGALTATVGNEMLMRFVSKFGRVGEEYALSPHDLNQWLMLAANLEKLEAVKAEMELRTTNQPEGGPANMGEPDITIEDFTAVMNKAVGIYREESAKLGETKTREDLRKCAKDAADTWHLRSTFGLNYARALGENFIARHLEISNETMVDIIMTIARIEDKEEPEVAKRQIADLLQFAFLDFRMRSSLGMFASR